MAVRLDSDFFHRQVDEVAADMVGKILVHRLPDGSLLKERIAETEAYGGEEDLACHASKGRTKRTEILYGESGAVYVYLCYGLHWMMNVITGEKDEPQGFLIRAGEKHDGPAKLTKYLEIDGGFNGKDICTSPDIWIEDDGFRPAIKTAPRVGIDYAGEYWKNVKRRFIAVNGE